MDLKRYYETFPVGAGNTSLRYAATLPLLEDEGELLDIGCDVGGWLQVVAAERENIRLSGVDVSGIAVRKAQKKLGSKANITEINGSQLPFADNSFDQVTILEVLEHIPDWQEVLIEAIRVTRRRIIITVPFNERLKTTQCKNCGTVAPLYGHVNSFEGNEFLPFAQRITNIGSINQFYGIDHYIERVYTAAVNRIKKSHDNQDGKEDKHFKTVCPCCYELIPYTEYSQRIRARLEKLLFQEPEFLAVVMEK